jgi:hypothetical protein
MMNNENNYYVYMYLREDGTPYYIGKGKDKRAWKKHKTVNLPTDLNRIILVERNLSEEEALQKENKLVLKYGRKDIKTGILYNRTDGGDEGRLRPGTVKWINNGYVSKRIGIYEDIPPDWKEGRINFLKEKYKCINNGTVNSRIPESKKIPKGWVKGRLGSVNKGYIYINDGTKDRFIPKNDSIPEGWKKGRLYRNNTQKLKKLSEKNKLNRTITNGVINKVIKVTDPIPDGWRVGRTLSAKAKESYNKIDKEQKTRKMLETKIKNNTLRRKPTKEQIEKMIRTRIERGSYKKSSLVPSDLEKFFD